MPTGPASAPPHAGQCSASTSKTRCKRSAQAVRPGRGTAGVTNTASRVRASVGTGPDSIDPGRRTGEAGGSTIPAPRSRTASRPSTRVDGWSTGRQWASLVACGACLGTIRSPQEGAGWPRQGLVVRTPNIGGAESGACFSYSHRSFNAAFGGRPTRSHSGITAVRSIWPYRITTSGG